MMQTLRNLFSSKKFIVLLASVIGYIAARFGFDVGQPDAEKFVALAAAYLIGQGIADHGKEAAKLESGPAAHG